MPTIDEIMNSIKSEVNTAIPGVEHTTSDAILEAATERIKELQQSGELSYDLTMDDVGELIAGYAIDGLNAVIKHTMTPDAIDEHIRTILTEQWGEEYANYIRHSTYHTFNPDKMEKIDFPRVFEHSAHPPVNEKFVSIYLRDAQNALEHAEQVFKNMLPQIIREQDDFFEHGKPPTELDKLAAGMDLAMTYFALFRLLTIFVKLLQQGQ